jgi:hypothetical protein
MNTMLNYTKLGQHFDYIVDDNPLKWDYLTPGENVSICSPERLREEDDFAITLGAWNFADEIRKKIRDRRSSKNIDYTVLYVPNASSQKLL